MTKCKTIAICNQKGGIGKTATAVNLGIGLAQAYKELTKEVLDSEQRQNNRLYLAQAR